VLVDPIKPKLKPPGTKRLKLKCDILLSNSGFKFKLRRYNLHAAGKLDCKVGRGSCGAALSPHVLDTSFAPSFPKLNSILRLRQELSALVFFKPPFPRLVGTLPSLHHTYTCRP